MLVLVPKPLVVIILDGWGISFVENGNAIRSAPTPTLDNFARYYPTASLAAAGVEVGLPWGEVGNSETGHSNIGAGQIQYQALPRIDKAISEGTFFDNEVLRETIAHAKNNNSQLHLMGLLSPGGIHSHQNHLFSLLEMAARENFRDRVFIHIFTDGRDTPPQSALTYLNKLEEAIGKYGVGRIASVTGRFWAMDRNENWDRTEAVYNMLIGGRRKYGAPSAEKAIRQAYDRGTTDEMIEPTAITRGGGPITRLQDNDALIFFNYRPDRARQLSYVLGDPSFSAFARTLPQNLKLATLAQYDPSLPVPAAFIDTPVEYPLARIISEHGLTQLHLAETEKYAHITYYLNGGHEQPFQGEDRITVPSSSIRSFAQEPKMAAGKITEHFLQQIGREIYDVYFINFANADMVGHTGNFAAAVEACAFVDENLNRIYQAVTQKNGALLITADHGNAEEMIHPATGALETDHTSNPVPLYLVQEGLKRTTPRSEEELNQRLSSPIGVISDLAPTILEILQLPKPRQMTGISLLPTLQQ